MPAVPACRDRFAPRKGRGGLVRPLRLWLKHGGKHGLHDGQTRRSRQRYPGRRVGCPWIAGLPACRARFADQAPLKGRGGHARPLRLWLKHGGKHGLHDGQTRRSRRDPCRAGAMAVSHPGSCLKVFQAFLARQSQQRL